MKEPILGRPAPRPIENLRDLLGGRIGQEQQGAPMAPDVETVISPKRSKVPRRPKTQDR